MLRQRGFRLAVAAVALLGIGGTLVIVQAQQPGGGLAPASPKATKASNNFQRSGGYSTSVSVGHGGAGMRMPMGMSMGMSGAIEDDPETAELVQAEVALGNDSVEIVERIAASDNSQDRKKLTAELRETLAKQFDVQRQRRELELGRIEEQARKLRDQMKKRDDARETIIDRRLDQLINEVDGLGWASPAEPTPPGGSSPMSTYSSSMIRSMSPAPIGASARRR